MYTLHIANKNYSSWSLRPWVLMRVLQIPFEEIVHPFSDSGNREAFLEFSPTARVPCLIHGEQVVWDSLAIVEYLAEAHAAIWPQDRAARCWARCATAEMHSGFATLRNECSMTCGQRVSLYRVSPELAMDLERINGLWCEGLGRFGGPYLAGAEFTAVDAFFAPVVFRMETYQLPQPGTALAYRERMLQLPALQDWYAAAIAEPWREASHEADIARNGAIVADYRL